MKIQTETVQFSADAQLISVVEQKVSRLQHFFNLITEVKVVLKPDDNSDTQKRRIAEIKLHLPNGIIFIKESSKTFEMALDKALLALKLQLMRYRLKRQSYCFPM